MFGLFNKEKNEISRFEFKFREDENTACIICEHVLSKKSPILYVTHDEEGDCSFYA